jgi:hypothetical protein
MLNFCHKYEEKVGKCRPGSGRFEKPDQDPNQGKSRPGDPQLCLLHALILYVLYTTVLYSVMGSIKKVELNGVLQYYDAVTHHILSIF